SDTAKFQAGCDDLRFTSVNGQAFDYWIESGCGTASTKIWVKVASIPAGPNGIATIYMYYGNPNAGAGSNTAIIPTSCSNINAFLGDGVYYIDPDGVGGNDAFQTYCDMTVNSGGWTMVGSLQDVTNRPIRHAYDSTDQWGCRGRWRDKTTTGVLTTANTVDYKNPAYWLLSANNTMFYMGFNPSSLTPSQWKNDSVHIAYTTNNFLSSVGGNFYNMFNDYYTFIHCDTKRSHGWCQPVTFDKGSSATIRSYMGTNSYNETAATSKWCFSPDSQTGDNSNAMGVPGIEVIGWNTEHYSFSSDYQHNCGEIHSWGDSGESSWSTGLWSFDPPNQYIYVMFFYRDTVPVSVNISAGTPAAEEKSPGPVAYWSFDEGYGTTAQDRTTNNNDGSISGAAWKTEEMCVSGKCLWFGSSNYVSVPVSSVLNLDQTFTFSAWIYAASTDLTEGKAIFMRSNGSGGNELNFSVESNEKLGVLIDDTLYQPINTIPLNEWVYVAATRDGSTLKFYINGVLDKTTTGVTQTVNFGSCNTLLIGTDVDSGCAGSLGNYWPGRIDEVKIYDYARTAAQVKADYNAQGGATSKGTAVSMGGQTSLGGLTSLSDGLVGYWKMDESSGSAVDSSGNGNTGTWNGTGSHYVAGKFGNGGGFNGTDDYIEKNSPSIFPSTAITTAFWIKTADSGDGIISYASTGGDNDWLIFNSGNIAIYRAASYVTTNIAINDNNWHHIVVTWRSSDGETKLYKDGAQVYSYTLASGTAITSGGCLDIAAEQDAVCGSREASQYHNGKIDEVRIYNRALSAAEVRQLYEWAPGPVGWWKMDEASWSGTSGEVKDFSGYGNNGTRGGNATTYSPGKYGKAGTFDGADDYVQATHNNSLNITNQITLEAWIKLNSLGSNKAVVAKGGWSTGYILHFDASYEGGTCDGDYGIQTYTTSAGGQFEWCNQPSMATNTWYHVAYTYDGTTEKAYHNGDLIQTKTSSGAMLSNTSNLYIGNVS
ncbi:MAG: DUF2341 domain-containing protein, partial [Candidatus Marinimicrobia bacterium]|nr:DUF2341 domain-containing protein [Candidatus Neomarinimicrobiota bacterium]